MSERPNESAELPDPPEGDGGVAEFDPAHDLPGAVLMVPNAHWGFEVVSADDHPGACVHFRPERRDGVLVIGTDAENARWGHYLTVEPGPENGLHKRTAFKLAPRYFRLHRLKLYFPERHIGRLDAATLRHLRGELARLNPEE